MSGRFLAGNLFIPGPAGQLEAIYKPAETTVPGKERAAVVCHPHPAHSGTMHNKVVFRAARALGETGFATLRFNFRGVGRSEGAYDEGRGERDDVRAGIDWLAAEHPKAELVVAGFSFGAWTGLPVGCADERVSRLVGIGTPVRAFRLTELFSCTKPKLFVHGTLDEHGPMAQMNSWYADLPEPKRMVRVEGADHFFNGHLDELVTAIREYFQD
jgi:alpha/beta superfamily hydrolase